MGGNVAEWTSSTFSVYPGGSYKPKPTDLPCKVFRGGAFSIQQGFSRTTSRQWDKPDMKFRFVGFRLAAQQ